MCGINGYVGGRNPPISEMNNAIAHRGPDFTGTYRDGNVALGHRLLSIREVTEESKQPVRRPDSPWVFIFNGQIYNTKELADKFSIPYRDLDTAMIADLLEKVGWSFVEHLYGMFALAVYNEKEKTLRLYRDSSGQKPLYYATSDNTFIFSSEIQGILAAGFPRETNQEGLTIAAALGYIPGHLTLLKGIYKLDAGEMITVQSDGAFKRDRYLQSPSEHFVGAPDEVMHKLVVEHLQSKQKVALNLSGGMDSSLLLHEMKSAGHELNTYTTSFVDAGESFNDDAEIARKLAKDYGTKHTEIEVTKDIYLNNFIESYALIEEPNYNISLPTYLEVAKREGVHGDGNRVILSGDGGDEVFGGYREYVRSIRYRTLMRLVTPVFFNTWKWLRRGVYFDYGHSLGEWLSYKYFDVQEIPNDKQLVTKYVTNIAERQRLDLTRPIQSLMQLDRALWMAGENFIRSDKLFMSQSLEMRSPLAYGPARAYFDARLKTDDYVADGGNKRFLRKLYEGKLPDYVVKREAKTGWRSPVRPWYDKQLKELFISILTDAPRGGVVQWDSLKQDIENGSSWPGKYYFLYLSLAILAKKYGLVL